LSFLLILKDIVRISIEIIPFKSEAKVRISIEISLLLIDFLSRSKGEVRISIEINLWPGALRVFFNWGCTCTLFGGNNPHPLRAFQNAMF